MKNYNTKQSGKTSLRVNQSAEGETIEQKIERFINNKEEPGQEAPTIYTLREDGVLAGYDIRTDRFEVALEAMDKVSMQRITKRQSTIAERKEALETLKKGETTAEGNGKPESTQGTSN